MNVNVFQTQSKLPEENVKILFLWDFNFNLMKNCVTVSRKKLAFSSFLGETNVVVNYGTFNVNVLPKFDDELLFLAENWPRTHSPPI